MFEGLTLIGAEMIMTCTVCRKELVFPMGTPSEVTCGCDKVWKWDGRRVVVPDGCDFE